MHFKYWLPLLATVSVISGQCDLTTRTPMGGQVTGMTCQDTLITPMELGQCVLHCLSHSACRVAYIGYQGASQTCVLCQGAQSFNFNSPGQYFLWGQFLTETVPTTPFPRVHIANGLSVGQVIVLKIVLWSDRTHILFLLQNDQCAFLIEFRLYTHSIVRNSNLGWWGHEERHKPHFNFAAGQEVEIVCIVRQNDYAVYMDKLFFFTYGHRTLNFGSIQYFKYAGSGAGGFLKSFFITS